MIVLRLALLLLLLPFLLVVRLVSRRRDMVYLPDDHEDMRRAVTEARSRLGEFRTVLQERRGDTDRFALKVRFPVEEGSEHIWLESVELRGASFHGRIGNDPQHIPGLAFGSDLDVDETNVTDWAYFWGGKAQGHFTTRALLPHVSRKMRRTILAALGWTDADPCPPSRHQIMNPGFYQMSFRGMSFSEAWRFSTGLVTFLVALGLKAVAFKGPKSWLPACEGEAFCEESQLTEAARNALRPLIAEAGELGYAPGRFIRILPGKSEAAKDGAAYLCLHRDGNRILHLAYVVTEAAGQITTAVVVTGGMVDQVQDLTYDFTHTKAFLDGEGFAIRHHVRKAGVTAAEASMVEFLTRNGGAVRRFSSLAECKTITDRIDSAMWQARIRRGLYIPVGDPWDGAAYSPASIPPST